MSAAMTSEAPRPTAPDDRALVAAARHGHEGAREALGRRVGRSAYLFALQLTGDPQASLDLAQDGVARFFSSLERFDTDRAIEPWLYQIVRNRARDLARRDRRRPVESLDALLENGQTAPMAKGSDPVVDVERVELQRSIWRAVTQLSDAHREIFVLRDYHELSYREIAETLAIPEGTVMSRLHAARTNLRALLAAERSDGASAPNDRSDR